MTDPISYNLGKEYHTGAGGKADAVRLLIVLIIWIALLAWLWTPVLKQAQSGEIRDLLEACILGVLVPVVLIIGNAYFIISDRNARVTISDEGVAVQNWWRSRKLILWNSIYKMLWYDGGLIYRTHCLMLMLRKPGGRRLPKIIWVSQHSASGEVQGVRDEIIAHCNLSESDKQMPRVLRALMRLTGLREIRAWRRPEAVT